MSLAHSVPPGDCINDCKCLGTYRARLEQNRREVLAWLRNVDERRQVPGKFVTCPPFPLPPAFEPSCTRTCLNAQLLAHSVYIDTLSAA